VYRFLLTPRWLGLSLLMLGLAGVMVGLGNWQLHRYHERSAINARIDAGGRAAPTALERVLREPSGSVGPSGPPPSAAAEWTRVTVSGRYDPAHEVLARGRTVKSVVGFEVITPLVLDSGAAVLVDRGWVPPARGGASAVPQVPPAPGGTVTVVGRVHLTESRPGTIARRAGRVEVRRISVAQLAAELPYPVYGAYVLMDSQDPPADPALVAIPAQHENAWQNAGYVVQWWIFAGLTIAGLVWLIRREPRTDAGFDAEMREMSADDQSSTAGTPPGERRLPQAPVSPAV
jgi:cytochrome oxidase assembly protein ShyY1